MRHKALIQAGLLLALFILCFWGTLEGVVHTWMTNDDYSYGFLIPVMAGYFIWEDRKQLQKIRVHPDFRALPFLLFFLIFAIYGILGSSYSAVRPSIPFILIFMTLLCFGMDALKKLWLPLGFLIFMMPIPNMMNRYLGEPLKLFSSKMGAEIIRLWGISVHTAGNVIDMGFTQLQVVDACSGLRFLFPLIALGVAYAYFFQKSPWKRGISVLATIPISVLTNGLRVGLTGILTEAWGTKAAEGFFHAFEGWAIFMVAFVFLFAFGWLLRFLPDSDWPFKNNEDSQSTKQEHQTIRNNTAAFITACTLLIVVGGLSWSASALPAIKIKGGLETFPLKIKDWQGHQDLISKDIVIASGAEESFHASYKNSRAEVVHLYLGYRSTPFMENENFFHTPISCFPAAGWKILEKNTYDFKQPLNFGDMRATRMVAEKMGSRDLIFFWFQTNRRATHSKSMNRLHLALHALKRENTHDLYVRLITPVANGREDEAEEVLERFAEDFSEAWESFFKENRIIGDIS
ncbi:hypothetical protein DSCO28_64320 [Desulfosarcina ovata subsp. sediminis]|uniref:Methanolan biosynthesis EpsI domain-containing protein n=1 Tax=Desulfosarcina ovata subsp. sediminis TaxID=885957 RepID=A0A5K8A0C6_9BACT|nr:exosortase C-terminal domain/associated protein EpsI [Desulfosarcina ovata]BBO85866.1 hypothetical protein DSCO28_64320 [Desulfosarcina ovata subsp. sediminis]